MKIPIRTFSKNKRINHVPELFSTYNLCGTHPADDLKNEGEKHRGVHAVVRACHVRRRPVGPAGEHHDGTLRLSMLIHIHIIEEHDDGNIWLVNPDESDNLQEAGHPCEATKQPKATSLQIKIVKKTFC